MQGEYYRLNTPSLAIISLPNRRRVPVTVPKGAVAKVVNGPLDGTRLVDVEWERRGGHDVYYRSARTWNTRDYCVSGIAIGSTAVLSSVLVKIA